VVLDIDETILDNSEYNKERSLAGRIYSAESWDEWVARMQAVQVPGVKDFIDAVRDEMHGQVILITNRTADQCPTTEENLRRQAIRYDRILCDTVGDGDKNGRFRSVIAGSAGVPPLNVLIWVGDNIQDFPGLSQGAPGDPGNFGLHYFVLPNPMYGSWQKLTPR